MSASLRQPIGIFDSGLGGLSVAREIRSRLPAEDLVYLADSAWCPYGGRPLADIQDRAHAMAEILLAAGAKLIVVACNTATIAAVESLRATYPVPFVGMEPAVKPAVAATTSGVVGVLATGAALSGEKFHQLVARHANGVRVITRPCPGLVEQIEAGRLEAPETEAMVREFTAPLLVAGADVLVLGCTHYPLARPLIRRVVGQGITLIDTGAAVARQVARVLEREGLLVADASPGNLCIRTTGSPDALRTALQVIWPDVAGALVPETPVPGNLPDLSACEAEAGHSPD